MMHVISNGQLEISVKSLGAELTGLKTIKGDIQFLWQGDNTYWGGQSPVLFPIIGGIPDGKYELDGKLYEMKSHGFAKTSEFELETRSETEMVFKLSANEDTLQQYPYLFDFRVTYRLEENKLYHGFEVVNRDSKIMLFSVGAHPAFNCPWSEGETMEDYRLIFEQTETLERRLKVGQLLSGETQPFLNGEREKRLTHSLFYNGAVILKAVKSRWLEIRSDKNPRVIRVDFDGFPDLGIWAAKNDGPFICIEPWYGVDSTAGDSQDLRKKEGMLELKPGCSFRCEYSTTII